MQLLSLEHQLEIISIETSNNIILENSDAIELQALRRRDSEINKIKDPNNKKYKTNQEREQAIKDVEAQYERGEFHSPDDEDNLVTTSLDDKRLKLTKVRLEIINNLKDIARMQHEASRLGLDAFMKRAVIDKIGEERYNDLNQYGSEDNIKLEIDKLKKQGASKEQIAKHEENLRYRGVPTIEEIKLIKDVFETDIKPKIQAHIEQLDALKNANPVLSEIIDGVTPYGEIKLDFWDKTKKSSDPRGVREVVTLDPSDKLSKRVRQFSDALSKTDDSTKTKVESEFNKVLNTLIAAFKNSSTEFLGGDENAPQRIFTATLYALYKVAPLLNIRTQEAEAKAAKDKIDAEKKAAEDKLKAQERATKEEERQKAEADKIQLYKLQRLDRLKRDAIKHSRKAFKLSELDNIILAQALKHNSQLTDRYNTELSADRVSEINDIISKLPITKADSDIAIGIIDKLKNKKKKLKQPKFTKLEEPEYQV